MLARFDSSPRARLHHELEHVVLTCPDPSVLGTDTRQLLNNLVETIRSGVVRAELRERVEQWGSVRAREAIARETRECGLPLTSMAWDAIEAAQLDELAFLLGRPASTRRRGRSAKPFVPCSKTARYDSYYAHDDCASRGNRRTRSRASRPSSRGLRLGYLLVVVDALQLSLSSPATRRIGRARSVPENDKPR